MGYSSASKRAEKEYLRLLAVLGPEFEILRILPLEEIRRTAGERTTEAIMRLRSGKVQKTPGFDGQYGAICFFPDGE